MEKFNLVELLRNCPIGMELDCTMLDNIVFEKIDSSSHHPIIIRRTDTNKTIHLTKYGQYSDEEDYKCIIFPKGKTTWEGFPRPFKDGDVLYVDCTDEGDDKRYDYIFILDKICNGEVHSYCWYYIPDAAFRISSEDGAVYLTRDKYPTRFATKEEKEKLFQAIKANGYKWNEETKTLEKLPKFKVGDKIKHKSHIRQVDVVTEIKDTYYILNDESALSFTFQDEYELVPNKFDITTLKPFDKVLVRGSLLGKWHIQFFEKYDKDADIGYQFMCIGGGRYGECIPYEGNEHLLNPTDNCDKV